MHGQTPKKPQNKWQSRARQKLFPDVSIQILGTGDMLFHVVQGTLGDSLLQDEVLQLMTIAVVLDTGSNLAEAIQEDFVIPTMVFIVPRRA